ncbi:MAG: AF1514 family protein [Desulfobacteraceae bacterium]
MGLVYPDEKNPEKQYVKIDTQDPEELDFAEAKRIAKAKALEICRNPMMLSWKNGKTGEFYPVHECGGTDREPWVVYAEARGADLSIDINDGDYTFLLLRM